MKEILFPTRIVASSNVANVENLLKKQPLQIGLSETTTADFSADGYVILDFGKEICASLRILTFASPMTKARFRFGESLTECCAELGGEQNATNDHALRDFSAELPSYSDMTFSQTGFRFVRIDFNGDARVKCAVAVSEVFMKPLIYRYEGEDECVARIFETAKHTVDLCASSGYVWDGVKRDRLVWIGDMHPEMLALTTLYGRLIEIERSLDFVKEQTPLPGWMNGFPTYSMWWMIILGDYYERTGAKLYVQRQLSYLEGLIQQMDSCVKEDGALAYPFLFVDWPTHETPYAEQGGRAINIMAIKRAIALLKAFDRDTTLAEDILSRLLKVEIDCGDKKQVIGLKYFAVGINEEEKKRLVEGNARGMSTFMSYYILKAVASFDKEKAIEMMKEYYGAMLDKGATSFFEDFDMAWVENSNRIDEFPKEGEKDIHGDFGKYCYVGFRHSLCHGWSAGVLTFIQEEC